MRTKAKKVVGAEAENEEDGANRRYVPLELITEHPELKESHRPLDKEWAEELSTDIENNGLDTPLIVWNEDGDTQIKIGGELKPASFLVAGLHRREALKQFRARDAKAFDKMFPEGVPVVFKTGGIEEALAARLRENVQRKDITPQEIFPLVERLRDEFKMKGKEIARRVGKSAAWVSEILSIAENLEEEGVEAVVKGGVTMSDAKKAARKIKNAKKKGKKLKVSEVLKKSTDKAAKKKAKGRERAEKRVSAKTAYKRYLALPSMKMASKIELLESTLAYLAGEEDELPDEIAEDAEESETED